jgi:hypothetical protein
MYAFMRRVLQSDLGRELYRRRQAIVEPVFADTKFNRRLDRFQRRGRSAANCECLSYVNRVSLIAGFAI